VGHGPGIGAGASSIEYNVLLLLWLIGCGWVWYGGHRYSPANIWCRGQSLTDIDITAVLAALGMVLFSFAPYYTPSALAKGTDFGPSDCSGLTDPNERAHCIVSGFEDFFHNGNLNAWQTTNTTVPVVLVLIVALLLLGRVVLPWALTAWIVKIITRILLLTADVYFGFALFGTDLDIFLNDHYGWGMWTGLLFLLVISLLAISSPPRFIRWLTD